VAGDIISGKAQLVVYDGTRFQLLNSPSFTSLKATTLAVSGATTLSSNVTITAPVSSYALDVGDGGGGSYSVRLGGPLFFSGSATVSGATAVAVMNYESGSAATRFYVGDGTGYSFKFAKRVASTTTDLLTISDSGNVTIAAPSSGRTLTTTGTAAGTASLRLNTTATNAGTQTATWTAPTNKPGAAAGVVSQWIPIDLDGTTYYIPAWT
jgi:hypothetical protein